MKTLLILALDGVMDSSLGITLDTLRAGLTFCAASGKPVHRQIMVAGYGKFVRTRGNLRLTTDVTFKSLRQDPIKAEWIVIPGLGLISDEAISSRFARPDVIELLAMLKMADAEGIKIAASCSAVFLLAQAGVMDGRQATMTWWLAHLFRARYPQVRLDETRMLVRDGHFLTSGSAFSQLDLSLAIVANTMGVAIANLCSRYLLIDERPSQARYMMANHSQHVDPTVIAAERWIDAHLSTPITISTLASQLAVSPKTLARRIDAATGMSPIKFIQHRRLLFASHLIQTTLFSIDAIAGKVGYQDSTALRKLVKREFGTTPASLR